MKPSLRFSLKTMLLVLIFGSSMFAIAYQYSTYPQRRWRAVQNALRAIGRGRIEGSVRYAPHCGNRGKWDVGNLLRLSFEGKNVTDDDLRHVRVLDPQDLLNLKGTEITDQGLKHLNGLRVKKIILTGTKTTKAGIASLVKAMHEDVEIETSN